MISEYYSKLENYVIYAHNLMEHFICQSIKINGPDFVSHNIHNLLHLSDCVKLYGALDNFSAFPFENYMQQLKKKFANQLNLCNKLFIVQLRNIILLNIQISQKMILLRNY